MKNRKNETLMAICRFHLAPDIKAEISKTGSVVITINGDEKRIFNTGSGKISLEETVYFGRGYPEKSQQIVIRAPLKKDTVKIRWAMQMIHNKAPVKSASAGVEMAQ